MNKQRNSRGGSAGQVVMGGDSCSKDRGFESQHRILDIFHIYLKQKLYCLVEIDENKRKRGREWPIFV